MSTSISACVLLLRPPAVNEVRAPIEPGRLLAAVTIGFRGRPTHTSPCRLLFGHGVTLFVNLTEEAEARAVCRPGSPRGRSLRVADRDFSVPSPAVIASALDAIDAELEARQHGVRPLSGRARPRRRDRRLLAGPVTGSDPRRPRANRRRRGDGVPQTAGHARPCLEWEAVPSSALGMGSHLDG